MPNNNRDHVTQASEYWRLNQPLKAGQVIFENLPTDVRPRWAANVLTLVIKRTGIESPAIENILRIASNSSDWKKAHEAFSMARNETLRLNKLPARTTEQTLLLEHMGLAELVAKVTYNATNPPDEFDQDSGWWIAVCLKNILDLLADASFSRLMWSVLCTEDGNVQI